MNIILHSLIALITYIFMVSTGYAEGYNVLNNSDGTPVEATVVYIHTNEAEEPIDYHYYRGVVALNNETQTHDILAFTYIKQGFKGDYEVFKRMLKTKRFKEGDQFKVVFLDRKLGQLDIMGTSEDGFLIFIMDTRNAPYISASQFLMYQAPLGKLGDKKKVNTRHKPVEKKITLNELIASVPKQK